MFDEKVSQGPFAEVERFGDRLVRAGARLMFAVGSAKGARVSSNLAMRASATPGSQCSTRCGYCAVYARSISLPAKAELAALPSWSVLCIVGVDEVHHVDSRLESDFDRGAWADPSYGAAGM